MYNLLSIRNDLNTFVNNWKILRLVRIFDLQYLVLLNISNSDEIKAGAKKDSLSQIS